MGARNRVGIWLSYQPARLHRLRESIPCDRFLGSLKVLKYRLWRLNKCNTLWSLLLTVKTMDIRVYRRALIPDIFYNATIVPYFFFNLHNLIAMRNCRIPRISRSFTKVNATIVCVPMRNKNC
jgi:hypothetical protein